MSDVDQLTTERDGPESSPETLVDADDVKQVKSEKVAVQHTGDGQPEQHL